MRYPHEDAVATRMGGQRTHEVDNEAGHAHELLLALAVMIVST
jgi:hypothetical protein